MIEPPSRQPQIPSRPHVLTHAWLISTLLDTISPCVLLSLASTAELFTAILNRPTSFWTKLATSRL
eukprot:scaffold171153_cov37-Tisochrysis_lutea.AAC.3